MIVLVESKEGGEFSIRGSIDGFPDNKQQYLLFVECSYNRSFFV